MEQKFTPKNLKVGDYVIVSPHYGADKVSKVEKISKAIIVVDGQKYNMETGYQIGRGLFFRSVLTEACPKKIKEISKIEKINKIKYSINKFVEEMNKDKFSLDDIKKVYNTIKLINK